MCRPLSTKRIWWLVIAAWAALLLGLGFWSALHAPATVRDQSDAGQARQVMDQVVGKVSGNVPADWHFLDDEYHEEACDLSVVREGIEVNRTLSLSGPSETERETLGRIASTLPDARLRPSSGQPEGFFADAGGFVAVRGKVTGPGTITIELNSGCRPK
jgi:hypothetical protein